MILLDKVTNRYYYDKAIVLIPEIENQIGIDMSHESFVKGDLPLYFYINIYESTNDLSKEKSRTFQYNFETEFGGGQIVISEVGSPGEKTWVNDTVNRVVENENLYVKKEELY